MLVDAQGKKLNTAVDAPLGVTDMKSFGQTMTEHAIKSGLQKLNQHIHFDLGAAINKNHPRIDEWQGVFINGQHLCSMDRGVSIPEYDVWHMNEQGERTHILRIGWRGTFEVIVNKSIEGVTWDNLRKVFGVERKQYMGRDFDLGALR